MYFLYYTIIYYSILHNRDCAAGGNWPKDVLTNDVQFVLLAEIVFKTAASKVACQRASDLALLCAVRVSPVRSQKRT